MVMIAFFCRLRCRWIDRVFLPAINQAGTDGWDIVRVANAIKDRAHSSGDEVCATRLLC
jgi:hypothetical protein